MSHSERRSLRRGHRIADFIVSGLLGQGGFGDIYLVESRGDPGVTYAMKVEPVEVKRNGILNERSILQQIQGSAYFPRYVDSGHTLLFRYLVMECLGPSLSDVRRVLPNRRFSLSTGLRVGIEMLRGIQSFHERGFVHRDVKPSNFLLRPGKPTPVALIDFGLARRFVHRSNGELVAPRENAGFVGTTKYASPNVHAGEDAGRRDDVISWLFSLFEMLTGTLPWVISRDRQETWESKRVADIAAFCRVLPRQLLAIWDEIRAYEFAEEPGYDVIIAGLVEAMDDAECAWDDPFDWETLPDEECARLSPATQLPAQHNDYPQPGGVQTANERRRRKTGDSSISGSYDESGAKEEQQQMPKATSTRAVKRKKTPGATAPPRESCTVM